VGHIFSEEWLMPGTQKHITQYAELSAPRQRAADAFLTVLSVADRDSAEEFIDEDSQSGFSWSFRRQLTADSGVSITTVTNVLTDNPEAIVGRAEDRGLSFPVDHTPHDLFSRSNPCFTTESTDTGEQDTVFNYPGTPQRDAESFGDLTLRRQLAIDGVIAAMRYLPTSELSPIVEIEPRSPNGDAETVTFPKQVLKEAVTVSGQPIALVKGVILDNSDILADRASIESVSRWVNSSSPETPVQPTDFRLPIEQVAPRSERYDTGLFWSEDYVNTQYLEDIPQSLAPTDWIRDRSEQVVDDGRDSTCRDTTTSDSQDNHTTTTTSTGTTGESGPSQPNERASLDADVPTVEELENETTDTPSESSASLDADIPEVEDLENTDSDAQDRAGSPPCSSSTRKQTSNRHVNGSTPIVEADIDASVTVNRVQSSKTLIRYGTVLIAFIVAAIAYVRRENPDDS